MGFTQVAVLLQTESNYKVARRADYLSNE